MKQSEAIGTIVLVFLIVSLVFVGVSLIINTSKSCDVFIDYDVELVNTTAENINQTSTLLQVRYACLNLCVTELKYDSNRMNACLDACEDIR